jgi:hypothetical protein
MTTAERPGTGGRRDKRRASDQEKDRHATRDNAHDTDNPHTRQTIGQV